MISQLFRSSQVSSRTWDLETDPYGWERNRPLEQIINEGSQGKVENKVEQKPVVVKTKAELDREYLITRFDPRRDLAVMSKETLTGILELRLPYPVPDGVTLDMLTNNIILISGVHNIGIVKG